VNPTLAIALAVAALSPAGAQRLETTTALQRSAPRVWPAPGDAGGDRSRAFYDGCIVPFVATRSPACVYGAKHASTTAVLFGDSHALQYFPALDRVARKRGWRLVVLTKAGCGPAAGRVRAVRRYSRACAQWRAYAIRRIARERPRLIVASGSTHYRVYASGRWLGRGASDRALSRGYVATATRLAATAPVTVIRDAPRPPFDVPACVADALQHLRRCAFARPRPDVISPSVRGIARVKVIDPRAEFCPRRVCPAVIGDALVYRHEAHITATYASTMWRWLDAALNNASRAAGETARDV
jgi:SGNH domain-containing protein